MCTLKLSSMKLRPQPIGQVRRGLSIKILNEAREQRRFLRLAGLGATVAREHTDILNAALRHHGGRPNWLVGPERGLERNHWLEFRWVGIRGAESAAAGGQNSAEVLQAQELPELFAVFSTLAD